MRRLVGLTFFSLGALVACATAPIGSLAGSGVGAPDRTTEDDDAGASPPSGSGSTAVLTVNLVGPGTVTSAPTGLTCTATACTGTFTVGTAIALAATPTGSAAFAGYTGVCTGPSCTVTLTANTAVTATFTDLGGTWKGTYENKRPNNNCTFDNKGTLTLTTASTGDAGTSVALTATMDGLEIRDGDCNLQGDVSGSTSTKNNDMATTSAGALTGTWIVNAGGFGNLDFPFKATISGTTMTGAWTCANCTGQFMLTKQP